MVFGLRWSGTGAFLAMETRVQLHEWGAIVSGGLVQGVLLIFVVVLAPSLTGVAVVGALVYSMFLIGQRVLNEAAYIRIDHKIDELYHASPLSPEAYFAGLIVGMLAAYLPPSLLLLAIIEIVHPLTAFAAAVLFGSLLAVWMISSVIGYFVSTLFKDMRTIWPYASLLTNLLGVVPPVFYPLRLVPPAFHNVVLVVPTSAAAALADWAAGIESISPDAVTLAAVSLAIEAIALFAFGVYWSRRSSREA